MARRGICAVCNDEKNPVTKDNGGSLSKVEGKVKMWIADVHHTCKAEYLKQHGAADYAGLETICVKCKKPIDTEAGNFDFNEARQEYIHLTCKTPVGNQGGVNLRDLDHLG